MGKQEMILKDIADAARFGRRVNSGRTVLQHPYSQLNPSQLGSAQPGDDRQDGRLAAAGRTINGSNRMIGRKTGLKSKSRRVSQLASEIKEAHRIKWLKVSHQSSGISQQ